MIKTISADIFNVTIEIATSYEEYKEIIDKNKIKEDDGEGERDWDSNDAFCFCPDVKGSRFFIMAFASVSSNLIIHESVHMALSIMSLLGVPISDDNSEILAYMTDHLSIQLFKLLIEEDKK